MPDDAAHSPNPVELLAPAGDSDALVAAVRNGADAVYLGLQEFNARRGAANFTLAGLCEACDFAHLRGSRVYLTVNVLLQPGEVSRALELIDQSWAAGVDAVIVQDLGLLAALAAHLPHVRVHASTQIGAHNSQTVGFLEASGVARVTLARELSVPEIDALSRTAAAELESFVHGALCVCYSGQCLLSSMIGGRSANRGRCAQPCRLPYSLVGEDGATVDAPGAYLLSPMDLAGIERLPDLIDAGVSALKIEGRVKSPEYVALVTGVYREAIDRACRQPDEYAVSDGEWSVLEEAFSRGFTASYLDGSKDGLMGTRRPNNRGVLVGRVASVQGARASLKTERELDARDRLEFWTGRGRFTQLVGRMTVDGRPRTSAPAGSEATIDIEGSTRPGDRVFRVANASLLDAARRTFARADEPHPTPVSIRVDIAVGEPLRVEVEADGVHAQASGPLVEPARTKAITADQVVEHVGRLGGTPYRVESWDVRLDPTAGLGFSALHRVRREALEELDDARLATFRSRSLRSPSLPGPARAARDDRIELVSVVQDLGIAQAVLDAGADRVLYAVDPHATPSRLDPGMEPLLSRIARGVEVDDQLQWARATGAATVGNLGVLSSLAGGGVVTRGDWSLNVTNAHAVSVLAEMGIASTWLSPELTLGQLSAVAAHSPIPVGVSVLGRQELMVTEHCVLRTVRSCGGACETCQRRSSAWWLEDRKGYRFPVTVDSSGRTHVFNAVPLDVTHALPQLIEGGVSGFRLDLGLESRERAVELTIAAKKRLRTAVAGRAASQDRLLEPSTTGHVFRGVD